MKLWLIAVVVIAAAGAAYWLWEKADKQPPQFESVLVSVNGEPRKLLHEETLKLHPRDRVRILEISTDAFFNRGVRLASMGFDVNALRYQELPLSELLGEDGIFDFHSFRVFIKHKTRTLGYVDLEIQPYLEDWLDKVNRTIDAQKRVEVLEEAYRLFPESKSVKRRLIDEYKALGRWKRAAEILEKTEEKKGNRKVLLELLEIYSALKDRENVVAVLKELVGLDPDDRDLRERLARILEDTGRKGEAVRHYEALLKHLEGKAKLPVYEKLGFLCAEQKQFEKAISFYLKAVELEKGDPNLYYNLYHLYESTRQVEKANEFLGKALALQPKALDDRIRLARRYMDGGKSREAESLLREVLAKDPKNMEALLLMAKIYEQEDNTEELGQTYRRILEADPKNDTVLYNLGVLEYGEDRLEESLSHMEEYAGLHPEDTSAHEILFDIYRQKGKEQKAVEEAKALLEHKPGDLEIYRYLFRRYRAQGKHEEIRALMEKGLKKNPDALELREYLIFAYLKDGMEDSAVDQMKKVIEEKQGDIQMMLQLARLQEKLGRIDEALGLYKRVIEISPGQQEAEEAYLRLRLETVKEKGK